MRRSPSWWKEQVQHRAAVAVSALERFLDPGRELVPADAAGRSCVTVGNGRIVELDSLADRSGPASST